MLGSRSTIARLQSDFYRDQFRRLLRWLMISVVIVLLLNVVILYLILFPASEHYYANTTEGKILPMPPPRIG